MNFMLIALYIYIFFIFYRMHKMMRKYKINFKYLVLNYVVLAFIAIINVPFVIDFILQFFDFLNRYQLMIATLFIYLIYNNFILEFNIARINQEQEKVISQMALIINDIENKKTSN